MSSEAPSLARRYVAKLGGNLFGMLFNFINASLVPRALGPVAYGSFEFLLSFFQQVMGFFDASTSTAFYNKLSRRNGDVGLIRVYGKFALLVFFLVVGGLAIAWLCDWQTWIWPGQDWKFILLAALLCYLAWVHEVLRKVVDAFGCTIGGEVVLLVSRASGAFFVIVLFLAAWISLTTLFLKELIFYAGLICGLSWIAWQHWRTRIAAHAYSTNERAVMNELWVYCSPLLAYAVVGVITGLADRWLLQRYAGSEEQGFYALAFRVGAVSIVFTSAMTQLIMREYSRAHGAGDIEQTRRLFRRYVPMLYVLTAYFSAFISIQADTVVWIFGGDGFSAAGPAMMLMALYPVHQTYGQMNGALLFATEKTKLYRNIGVVAMLGGLILTWGFLAPRVEGGLEAGSMGLAIKMVLLQFVAVNVQLWFNLKNFGLKFRSYFLHQIGVLTGFLLLALIVSNVVEGIGFARIIGFIVAGMAYTVLVGFFVIGWPSIAGVTKLERDQFGGKLVSKLLRRVD